MITTDKIYVAGHNGLVGSAIVRALREQGYKNLVLKTRKELDLLNPVAVEKLFQSEKPDYVFLAAARCGGISDNIKHPVEFLKENLDIQNNIIHNSHIYKVKKLLFLGSACIYPRECEQPMREEFLMSGPLEPTNESYSLAKIAGIKLCQAYAKQCGDNFICAQPANVYGPKDNFNPESSHVIGGLISKFYGAKRMETGKVECWGTGSARREFIFVDDLADALIFLMQNYDDPEIINVGVGKDVSIKELVAHLIDVVEYDGEIIWDTDKPEGMPKRLLDVSKLNSLGWEAKTSLDQGLKLTYEYYKMEVKGCTGR